MPQDPIVEPADLAGLGRVRILDARPADAFAAGHAPGAVRVPVEAWAAAATTPEGDFDQTAHWQAAIADLGVDGGTTALVYDAGNMLEAARVWFVLQYFGAKALMVNGGWPAMQGAAMPEAAPAGAGFTAKPGAGPVGLVDRHRLRETLGEVEVMDTRTAAEFSGEDTRNNPRVGHMPGARLVPHADLLDGGRVRPADEVSRLFADAGFGPGDHIVTHCQGGARAALAAAAGLRAGYRDFTVYYLSFGDWARDESCPITRD